MVISAITIPSLRYPLGEINEADAALSATRSLAASRRSDPSSAIRAALGWAAHPTCTQLANPCRTLRLQQEAEQVPLRPSSPAPRLDRRVSWGFPLPNLRDFADGATGRSTQELRPLDKDGALQTLSVRGTFALNTFDSVCERSSPAAHAMVPRCRERRGPR